MSSTDLLINPSTKKQVELFIKSQFPCLALIGSKGSGKLYLAKWITDQLLAQNLVMTEANTVYINGSVSGIEAVREAQKSLGYITPGRAKFRRALIIENFDDLGHEAQNAMLKTLEEPPSDTIIIITINRQAKVLQTIYSRTRQVVVKSIPKKDILKSYNNISEQKINSAYALSMGQPGLFVSLISQAEHPLVLVINQAKNFLKLSKQAQLAQIDTISKNKDPEFLDLFLDALLRIFYTSYKLNIDRQEKSSPNNLSLSISRLKNIKLSVENINNGLNKKLALTQLILKI